MEEEEVEEEGGQLVLSERVRLDARLDDDDDEDADDDNDDDDDDDDDDEEGGDNVDDRDDRDDDDDGGDDDDDDGCCSCEDRPLSVQISSNLMSVTMSSSFIRCKKLLPAKCSARICRHRATPVTTGIYPIELVFGSVAQANVTRR